MNIVEVAKDMQQTYLSEFDPYRHEEFEGREEHLVWMLDGIIQGYIQHEKAHRWIGFVQGVLVGRNLATVEHLKKINRG